MVCLAGVGARRPPKLTQKWFGESTGYSGFSQSGMPAQRRIGCPGVPGAGPHVSHSEQGLVLLWDVCIEVSVTQILVTDVTRGLRSKLREHRVSLREMCKALESACCQARTAGDFRSHSPRPMLIPNLRSSLENFD